MRSNSRSEKTIETSSVVAETHPPEYLLHKYWARKPHNVIRHYLKSYFKPGDLLVDPFCGSGVFLAEAKKLGINSRGYDINPIAFLISSVTTDPPSKADFERAARKILELAKSKYEILYQLSTGGTVRYVVHQMITRCGTCNVEYSSGDTKKVGNRSYCPRCNLKLSFNQESCVGTKIVKIYDKQNNEILDEEELAIQENVSKTNGSIEAFNIPLVTNRRILAFPDMKTSDLFTPRAFTVLCDLFQQAHKIEDTKVKNAILLLLTSATAQCSRLIPSRNNLKTGGPAWTVPGFWIAPVHLETNPLIHLEARFGKFIKGIGRLSEEYKNSDAISIVTNQSATNGLGNIEDETLNGIFFDPPYGDNVPYVEFSSIWNSFLNRDIEYTDEIVVSDRKTFKSSWDKYQTDIEKVIGLFFRKLKDEGKVIMTFNNLDPRAWKIVLGAFSKYSFRCNEAKYQIPAVVSAKAQMAANTSYIGDYYCVFSKTLKPEDGRKDLIAITERLRNALQERSGRAPVNLIQRIAILMILNEGFDVELIGRIEDAIKPIATLDIDHFQLRDMSSVKNIRNGLKNAIIKTAQMELSAGKKPLKEIYEKILLATDEIGGVPLSEVKIILQEIVHFEKEFCYLKRMEAQQTMSF